MEQKPLTPCAKTSFHVAEQGDGPFCAQDGDEAVGGVSLQLVEENSLPSNEAHKDFDDCKILFRSQAQENIAAIKNESIQEKLKIYAKIASTIPTKTIRDVAWRFRSMDEIFSGPSEHSSSHVSEHSSSHVSDEEDCTCQDLIDFPKGKKRLPHPHLKLDKELVCLTAPFFPDHKCQND